jgi:hypothetical protein
VEIEGSAADAVQRVIPALVAGGWKVEVVTQFASGGTRFKYPRIIEFKGELTVSAA